MIGSAMVLTAAVAAAPLAPGDKARLTLHDGRTLTCAVVESDATTLRVRRWTRVPEPEFDLAWTDVHSVKRSLGTARGKGLMKGVLIGGGIGLAYGLLGITGVFGEEYSDGEYCSGVGCLVLTTIPSAIIGGAVGVVSPRERWEVVEPRGARAPRHGVSIAVSF